MDNNKTRTVSFPLKLKLILLFSFLITSSLSFYVYFATNLFNKDKTAYIFESGLSHVESLSLRVNSVIQNSVSTLKLLGQFSNNKSSLKTGFQNQSTLLSFQSFRSSNGFYDEKVSIYAKSELKIYESSPEDLQSLEKQFPIDFDFIKSNGVYVKSFFSHKAPHLLMGVYERASKSFYVGRVLITEIAQAISSNKIYDSFLLGPSGEVLYSTRDKFSKKNVTDKNYLLKILAQNIKSSVREVNKDSGQYLLAFKKNDLFGVNVFAEISKEKAFYAARYLERKSIWFGLFLLSIVIMIVIIFSRRLTKNIEKLSAVTAEISKGNFSAQVSVSSHDEIGVLSDSFNFMSQKIVHFIGQMKEKARIENEIAVAKLVQDSFFPQNDIAQDKIDISAFYTPASECGGDWWGHIRYKDKTIIGIIDATGHGVPAALLTATANCCFENLKSLANSDSSVIESPASILKFMNHAVCGVGSDILMTAFVAIVDHTNNKLAYSNASHNPPLYFAHTKEEVTKDSFRPLMDANSSRLGHESDATFTEASIEINPNDAIIFFTDGITEGVNKEGKQFGPRRFIKSLASSILSPLPQARDNIMKEAFDFYDGCKNDDDITLVLARIK